MCDAFIATEQAKRDLKLGEVLGNWLPSETYNLLCQVKARAATTKHKYVGVRDRVIRVRKADGLPVIEIHNSSEVFKLT